MKQKYSDLDVSSTAQRPSLVQLHPSHKDEPGPFKYVNLNVGFIATAERWAETKGRLPSLAEIFNDPYTP
jgi:hypothetical protein